MEETRSHTTGHVSCSEPRARGGEGRAETWGDPARLSVGLPLAQVPRAGGVPATGLLAGAVPAPPSAPVTAVTHPRCSLASAEKAAKHGQGEGEAAAPSAHPRT